MIKKEYLFSLVVFCSLFFLTACSKDKASDEVTFLDGKEQKLPVDTLMQVGFVPPVIRLPDSYVNDKIESKVKKLSYEFYYYRLSDEDGDFASVLNENLFNPIHCFHTTTISEDDAGLDSKAKIKYDKLRDRNGGNDICIGTKFILGLKVKDQSGNLVYQARIPVSVYAPVSKAKGGKKAITVPGDQTAFGIDAITATEGGVTVDSVTYKDNITTYNLSGGKQWVRLQFGDFGKTNRVYVTE